MSKKRLAKLTEALESGALIRFGCRFDADETVGWVLAIGEKFLLVAAVSDYLRRDGFRCFRINDVRKVRGEAHPAFVERALELRGQLKPAAPVIGLDDPRELLNGAAASAPLVSLFNEKEDAESCYIGRILDVGKRWVTMLEIAPGANWEVIPTKFLISAITRVDFGGDYEDALYLVGGEPEGAPQPWVANG